MTISALWARLIGEDAVEEPLARWQTIFGEEFTRIQPFLVETGSAAASWLCGRDREGCARRVIAYGDHLAAVCTASEVRCARIVVQPHELALWRLDPALVLRSVARAARLIAQAPSEIAPHERKSWLGRRAVGGVDVRFYAVVRADAGSCAEIAVVDASIGAGLCVILSLGAVTGDMAQHAANRGVNVVALPDAVTLLNAGNVEVNLDALYHEHRGEFQDVDPSTLLSLRKKLIIDYGGGRAWIDHQLIDFPSKMRLPLNLLVALARHAGANVPRARLYPEVWRDDYTPSKAAIEYRGAIRRHRLKLNELAAFPITAVAEDDDRGGYRLDLSPDAVELWSEPPPLKQPKRQAKIR